MAIHSLDIGILTADKLKIRKQWDVEFETNHKVFAEEIALSFAQRLIEKFGNDIQDPFKKGYHLKNTKIKTISFEIDNQKNAKKIQTLAKSTGELPPFKTWLTRLATVKKDEDHFHTRSRRVDDKYFAELMMIVGKIAAKKLNELLTEFVSDPKHVDLQFKCVWFSKSEQTFDPYDSRDNHISIELWLKNNEAILSPDMPSTSGGTSLIDQHRMKQREIQVKQETCQKVSAIALVVLVIGIMYILHITGKFQPK